MPRVVSTILEKGGCEVSGDFVWGRVDVGFCHTLVLHETVACFVHQVHRLCSHTNGSYDLNVVAPMEVVSLQCPVVEYQGTMTGV